MTKDAKPPAKTEQQQASIQVVEDKLNALLWHLRINDGTAP